MSVENCWKYETVSYRIQAKRLTRDWWESALLIDEVNLLPNRNGNATFD
jgi:hypothetical protein